MSNQEAIALLRNLEDALDSYCELNEEGKTAFRMAIEALSCSENPNNSDCISRQAAIDAVKKNTFRLTFAEEQNCEGHVAWSAEAVYSDVMEGALLDLPSAQPQRMRGKWTYGEDEYGIDGYHCDKCGFFVPWDYTHKFIDFIKDYHFCPNCGADMRSEQDG